MSLYGCGYTYPIGHWGRDAAARERPVVSLRILRALRRRDAHPGASARLQRGRHPDHVGRRVSAVRLRPARSWNGRDDWTLASYYAAGNSFCVDPAWVNDFGLGNNGQQGAADTGQYWYFSGVQLRTDTWPGPVAPASGGDTIPPVTSLTAPAAGATVSGTVNVTANATDNVGVAGVQFKLDGAALGAEDTAAPYSVSWNTTAAANGIHSLTAVARDAAGNQTTRPR